MNLENLFEMLKPRVTTIVESHEPSQKQYTEQEILAKIREGLDVQIKQVIEEDGLPQEYVHAVTHSYLLLKTLEKLDRIDRNVDVLRNFIDE